MENHETNVFTPDDEFASQRDKFWFVTKYVVLLCTGVGLTIAFAILVNLSQAFALDADYLERPIIQVVACFGVASLIYLLATFVAGKISDSWYLFGTVIFFAVTFRVGMFFSTPIQEIDIYRYIWDGVVVTEGVSPFRFSPDVIRNTPPEAAANDVHLQRLIHRYRRGHGDAQALYHVHFGQVPTVYPPVSQAVFALAAAVCAEDASLAMRLGVMKGWLILFDIGTVLVLIALLKSLRMPIGYAVGYAWCPLVMKEIANSGHLDSIAIFLTTLSVWLFVNNILLKTRTSRRKRDDELTSQKNPSEDSSISESSSTGGSMIGWTLPVIVLALAIGAKIYAIVLAPLFCFVAIRRLGIVATIVPTIVFAIVTTAVLYPMLPSPEPDVQLIQQRESDPSKGMEIFLKYWEMNDFLFMTAVENLKPESLPSRKPVWFSVVPDQPRQEISDFVVKFSKLPENEVSIAPFLATRFLLTGIFLVVTLGIAIWAVLQEQPVAFCRAVFLTLAWFWLLAPTQNPWYWLWALPMIPFIKNRTWYLMSGLLFIYYLRFYFEYHCSDSPVAPKLVFLPGMEYLADHPIISQYQGVDFFDFVVTWVEYLPWFVLLIFETMFSLLFSMFRRPRSISPTDDVH